MRPLSPLALLASAALACAGLSCAAAPRPPAHAAAVPFDEARALHVLQRLAFGPSRADLEAMRQVGVEGWVEGQLAPGGPLPAPLQAKLAGLPTLAQTSEALLRDFPPPGLQKRQAVEAGEEPERVPLERRPASIVLELSAAKVVRAVESPRQLEEVLVDFWLNHFNVSAEKGAVRWLVTSYERDALRPHVLGTFRELLGAVAHHPAMLFYLDNWQSTREGLTLAELRGRPRRRALRPGAELPQEPVRLGLNENYARELLELHTLGVDGGYTQQDVREVARCFTGWSIRQPRRAPDFLYRPMAHDTGEKRVLGTVLPAGGQQADGERVLDLLAAHPSTAHHLALALARRFVSDAPPPALVDRVARVFLDTHGHLPSVYRALFTAPEFWSPEARGAKTKTPLEFVASALRATGARVQPTPALVRALAQLGEPLYRAPAPTGFPERAESWVNTGALVGRLNFGLALAAERVPGVAVDLAALVPDTPAGTEAWVDALSRALLHAPLSPDTRATLLSGLSRRTAEASAGEEAPPVDVPLLAGLLLGSPEFQKQ